MLRMIMVAGILTNMLLQPIDAEIGKESIIPVYGCKTYDHLRSLLLLKHIRQYALYETQIDLLYKSHECFRVVLTEDDFKSAEPKEDSILLATVYPYPNEPVWDIQGEVISSLFWNKANARPKTEKMFVSFEM